MYESGRRIRDRRKQLGKSQEELAEMIQTDQTQISRYENGKNDPTGEVLTTLARALNTSSDYLLGLTDDPTPRMSESDLSPMERKLVAAVRNGFIVEALETFTTLSKGVD